MASPIPSSGALRLLRQSISPQTNNHNTCGQVRHATLLRRPKRPYTFTQLVTLSDGSSYLHRTTSPAPIYKSTKDTRNTPLWNPSSQKLLNVEEDEAGKLRMFREKFGRGWDAEGTVEALDEEETGQSKQKGTDHLLDLISGYQKDAEGAKEAARKASPRANQAKGGKKK